MLSAPPRSARSASPSSARSPRPTTRVPRRRRSVGKRSRKRRAEPAQAVEPRAAEPKPAAPPQRGSRSEVKNAAVREQLEPIEEGERPLVLTIGALVTFAAAAANLIAFVAGQKIGGERPAVSGIVAFTALMLAMAWGLLNKKYWAVLGLEALLGLLLVILSLFLLRAENLKSALIVVAIVVPAGALFWFNVRVMARIQMPERPRR